MKVSYNMKLLTLKRLAIYLITFFTLLILMLLLTNFWKQWDTSFYKSVYIDESTAASKLSSDITVVNIEKPDLDSKKESLKQFRQRIISFLNTVEDHYNTNNETPEAIIFDISFSNDTIQLKELREAIEKVKAKRIDVYAVYSLKHYFDIDSIFESNDYYQARVLYDSVLVGGRLHAAFVADKRLIYYPSDLFLRKAFLDTIKIESIIKRVALDDKNTKVTHEFENLVTPLGPKDAMEKQTYVFIEPEDSSKSIGSFDSPFDMHDKFILIGDLKNDYQDNIDTPRTYFMAWALNEKIVDDKIAKQPLNDLSIIIGQTLFFSLLTVLVFALLFKYIKRLQTKPKTLALVSFITSLIFFAIYGMLIYTFDKVIPIGMTLVGMAIAGLLSWRFAYKFLVTGIAEGAQKYDVFISYSHGNSDWVKKNVFEPLDAFRKPNGDKLNIFFDVKSIGIGEAFTSKYMWGIVDSKFFIPIISEEYYGKNHCKNEMDLAYKRSVEKLLHIMPIVFSFDCVPEIYTHINFADIMVNPNFIESIKNTLQEGIV